MTTTISTGQPSTLKTYRGIALALTGGDEQSRAVQFFDDKIKDSPNGEDEGVIADEGQMMLLIAQLIFNKE